MKRFFAVLSLCLIIISSSVPNVQAQRGKVVKQAIELISKGAKKAPKKTPVVKPKAPVRQSSPKIRPHSINTVTCSHCNGKGTVTYWNSYYGQYQTATCTKCNGAGKVRKN